MNVADLSLAGPEDLRLWARTAAKGEAAAYGEAALAAARDLAAAGAAVPLARRVGQALQRLLVKK